MRGGRRRRGLEIGGVGLRGLGVGDFGRGMFPFLFFGDLLLERFHHLLTKDVLGGFPRVLRLWISFPLDQVKRPSILRTESSVLLFLPFSWEPKLFDPFLSSCRVGRNERRGTERQNKTSSTRLSRIFSTVKMPSFFCCRAAATRRRGGEEEKR